MRWNQEEIDYIKNNYGKINCKELANKLNRSLLSIYRMADKLNLKFTRPKIGDIFGRWTIIEDPYSELYKTKYRFVAKVQCNCQQQTIKIISLEKLKSGKSKSCGCFRIEQSIDRIQQVNNKQSNLFFNNHPRYKGIKELSLTKYNMIKNGAIKRNIYFDDNLTIEKLYELLEFQNFKCRLTGIKLRLKSRYYSNKDNSTASLDRINSSLFYTIDNIRWVHKQANLIKFTLLDSELIYLCNLVTNFKQNFQYYYYNYSHHGNKWKGYGDLSQWYFNSLKKGAYKRNIKFDINLQEIWELFLLQNARCALTGEKINFGKNFISQSASLDRIDPTKGYTIDNLQWTLKIINKMKVDLQNNEFKYWCRLIYEYANKIPNAINGL